MKARLPRKDDPMIPSLLPTYARAPLSFVKGEGAWMIEEDGRRFLDLGAGIAVNALGHANPRLVQAAIETDIKNYIPRAIPTTMKI